MKDYSEAQWKMDKFMSDNADLEEYDEIIDSGEVEALVEFIEVNCVDEDRMYSYFPKGGTVQGFAKHILGISN
jgi:hypothetical protein